MSDELQQTMFAISQKAYESGAAPEGGSEGDATGEGGGESPSNDDDVIDAEYTKE